MLLRRRLVGVVTALALALGQVGLCAGWSPSPEARKACCSRGSCPMHENDLANDAAGAHGISAHRGLDQSEADRCCGLSEQRDDPAPSAAGITPIVPLALLTTPVTLVVELDAARRDNRVPRRAAAGPRPLLLSVLLGEPTPVVVCPPASPELRVFDRAGHTAGT